MDAKTRIVVNTSAQYLKTIICGVITLYSSRVILSSLGVDDFGIYSLVAGVVMMLSFLTNALSSTTQRFISYYQGAGELSKVKAALTNSLCIHVALGLVFAIFFLSLTPFLFNGFLNIAPNRMGAAASVYYAVIVTLFVSFITSPYRAVLISHENIVFISLLDTIDITLKLVVALSLSWVGFDKLVYYGWALLLIQFFDLLASAAFCYIKYEECTWPNFNEVSKPYLKGLLSFAGWNVYSLACTYGRTQGIAIALNKFLGTVVNAAYGIGLQLSSYVNYMSESLLNAIRPQIIKAEGGDNRDRMFLLSEKASKFSFFLLSTISIPCVFEMPFLLRIWLGDYPVEAIIFCQCFLLASLADSLSIGLHTANQAIGNLRAFALIINTTKLIALPVSCICLYCNMGVISVGIAYVLIEFICSFLRVFVLSKDGLNTARFIKNVYMRVLPTFLLCTILNLFIINIFEPSGWRFLLSFVLVMIINPASFYLFGMDSQDRLAVKQVCNAVIREIGNK